MFGCQWFPCSLERLPREYLLTWAWLPQLIHAWCFTMLGRSVHMTTGFEVLFFCVIHKDSIACIALPSACVTDVRTQQDMDNQIKSVHDGWVGTKKHWASEVWSIVGARKLEGSLFNKTYTLPQREPPSEPEAAGRDEQTKNKMPACSQ